MKAITRPLEQHAYAAGSPRSPIAGQHGAAIVHVPGPRQPSPGMTAVSAPHAPAFAADGAPFYNTGYAYPRGQIITGGALGLRLPPAAAMLDLTDMTTWDRPVRFYDAS